MRQVWTWFALVLFLWFAQPAQAQEWSAAPAVTITEVALPPVEHGLLTVPGVYVEVVGQPEEAAVMRRLGRHANRSVRALAEELGMPVGGTIRVMLTSSQQDFDEDQPGDAPTWADATAYPGRGLIYLRSPRVRPGTAQPLETVLDHELTHIVLGRAFAPEQAPRWLQEGVARVMAGEHTPDTTRELARGVLTGAIRTLDDLDEGFYSHHGQASLAYAQASDFVSWFRVTYGDDAFRGLLGEMAGGRDLRGAIYRSTGEFHDEVERAWRSRLTRDGGLRWYALFNENLAWLVAAILGVWATIRSRRRFHARLAEMEREEAEHDALMAAIRNTWFVR